MKSDKKLIFVGPLPPPIHGFAEINRRMLDRLQLVSNVEAFDVTPRSKPGVFSRLSPWLRLFFSVLRICSTFI